MVNIALTHHRSDGVMFKGSFGHRKICVTCGHLRTLVVAVVVTTACSLRRVTEYPSTFLYHFLRHSDCVFKIETIYLVVDGATSSKFSSFGLPYGKFEKSWVVDGVDILKPSQSNHINIPPSLSYIGPHCTAQREIHSDSMSGFFNLLTSALLKSKVLFQLWKSLVIIHRLGLKKLTRQWLIKFRLL